MAAILTVAAGPVAQPRHRAAFPGENGRIAAARAHVGERHEQIVTVSPDGTDLRVLTSFRYGATEPAWSPDGTRIVFVKRSGRDLDRYRDVWFMNADGTGLRRVTRTTGAEYNPSWSPDGDRIVYERSGDIYTIGRDGAGRMRLTATPRRFDVFPAWSPDGTHVAYSSWPEASFASQEIFTIPAAGGDPVQVTNNDAASLEPNYAPDGTRLVFQYLGGGNDIAVVDADGDHFDVLTATPRAEFSPVWSPDGERIAFSAGRYPDGLDLYTMAADGTDEAPVTAGDRNWFDWPDWQPLP